MYVTDFARRTKALFKLAADTFSVLGQPVGEHGWEAEQPPSSSSSKVAQNDHRLKGQYFYTREFDGVHISDEFISRLNQQPLLGFWLADRATGDKATMVNPFE